MLRCDEAWLRLTDDFYDAALDPGKWYAALDGLARATGSRSGELITIAEHSAVPSSLITNIDPAGLVEFAAVDGGNPQVNPRVKAGLNAELLKPLAEADFLSEQEHRTHPHYRDFAARWDVPFSCIANLDRSPGLLIGLSVLRSRQQGHIDTEQKRIFASLAQHVRAAVRMHRAFAGNAAALLTGAFEALAMAAFVCDRRGCVQGMTGPAEEMVSAGAALQLRNGKLRASRELDDKALNDAIEAAARGIRAGGAPLAREVVVLSSAGPLVMDIMPMPNAALEFVSRARVVVVVRGSRSAPSRKAAILRHVYRLTSAEAEVALSLAEGNSTTAIAQSRDVAVGTVRAQIKTLLPKLGVTRQVELVARLNCF
jgi:DNA-binding CsgD family transcriptional regulator